ncbi:hypothetical protein ACGF12_35100 [Kitasatospora sp. NPDC048296]|uniref:hypothetical protein n=1 Tax=Kitasatospora sp. NPDC048296 TaxID=3364048 RepID=UPI00371EB0A6
MQGEGLGVASDSLPGLDEQSTRLQVAESAWQSVIAFISGRNAPAAARPGSIAHFSDFISESILRTAEQAREVLHANPKRPGRHLPGSDRG